MGTLKMLADMSSSDNSFLSLNSFPCVSSSPLFCQSPAFILKYFRNFASLFYVRYLVVKTQSNLAVEFKTQFSIFFISITYASLQLSKLYSHYIIHQKTTSTEDVFSACAFFSGSTFSKYLVVFKWQFFYSLSISTFEQKSFSTTNQY